MKRILILMLLISFTGFSQNLVSVYKKVNSSIVVIKTMSNVSEGAGDKQKVSTASGLGSGVLISDDGLIWTASHVVHSADKISLKFTDGDIYEAVVLSTDPLADVALIKVNGDFQLKNKHIAVIGNSDNVNIGEDIFVVGAPLGIEQTLTRGIVSGRIVPDKMGETFLPVEYIQTDAAINPGNSGGPMFNMKGEIIGIASFIMSQSGSSAGLGFGASSNVAKKVLMEQPNIWSGLEYVVLQGEMADVFNLPQAAGLLITSVTSKGLGDKMGLKGGFIKATIEGNELLLGGDVILEVAGVKLDTAEGMKELRRRLSTIKKGESYMVKYLRGGNILLKAMISE